ncbi:hypothetical protein HK099_006229 [Clydaea vesicula]|uniref:ASCH domain-containing protein n=1 Tax=Clydaea vesicula TaxID=447962 RepID=A0AAD5XZ76_9FUNG|nr:hypothetical protein HK099_006229 [Clydaea vesicula]KAJ3379836.1 hypothetical protein HDU92_006430 [Lobulomyces angularis]
MFNNNGKEFLTKVIGIRRYFTFADYLTAEGLEKCLPVEEVKTIEDGVKVYRQYFSEDEEDHYGVVAFEVERV